MSSLKMVVGLGNPGRRYENNRHNIGFRVIELYAERYRIDVSKKQSKSLMGQGEIEGRRPLQAPQSKQKQRVTGDDSVESSSRIEWPTTSALSTSQQAESSAPQFETVRQKVLLVKPQTYMNNSGEAVQSLASYYNIKPIDILAVHDHMDLPTGTLRLRPGGGAGGQNGIRSIINRLGGQDFPRLRIGVGRPPGRMDPAAYVLQDFRKAEAEIFGELADTVVRIIDTWLFEGIDAAMNQFNGRT